MGVRKTSCLRGFPITSRSTLTRRQLYALKGSSMHGPENMLVSLTPLRSLWQAHQLLNKLSPLRHHSLPLQVHSPSNPSSPIHPFPPKCYRRHLHQSRGRLGAWVSRGNRPLVAIIGSVSTYLLLWLITLVPVIVCRHLPPSAPSVDVPMTSIYVCVFWTLLPPSI